VDVKVALETAVTTVLGSAVGVATGAALGPGFALVFGVIAGTNGVVAGLGHIYDPRRARGWFGLVSDSSWGLAGTVLGCIVHAVNLFWPESSYRRDLSRRHNRHVYAGGMRLRRTFAFTIGNVVSNAALDRDEVNSTFITNHEELHVWQNRIFGPLFPVTYIVWGAVGAIVGAAYWLGHRGLSLNRLVETAAYYDNPFELWAYKNDDNWPPSRIEPALAWGRGRGHG
jgi:hypothetical protein